MFLIRKTYNRFCFFISKYMSETYILMKGQIQKRTQIYY